ncbi:MAG: isoaspartyl peptidase/L-asparaginase [Leptospirales bacterium]
MALHRTILTHGGAGSDPKHSDGTETAAAAGMKIMENEGSSLDAVVQSVIILEDDPRFNAGLGSRLRVDGTTIELDASCMTSDGNFGSVICVEGIQNPIEIARGVLTHSHHIGLAGKGARIFADEHNISLKPLKQVPEDQNNDAPSCDTVGAVAFDGKTFAAALSTGGLKQAAIGRVSDVPLPGCGLFCGPIGAVACTGDGEYIAGKILAKQVYDWIEQEMPPEMAVEKAIALFEDSVDIGLLVLTKNEFFSNARRGMAQAHKHHP